MSQHDFDLANQPGAAFRSDANSALQALVTQSSGASAPSTTYAYQLWADTSTGLMKQRNAANSAWTTLWAFGTSFQLTAPVIDRAYAEYTTNAALTAVIPADDTIPQNTEGTQIISVAFTPKSVTNRLRLRFRGEISVAAATNVGAAIFSSASANALRAGYVYMGTIDVPGELVLEHEYVPATTSALTFTVRVGPMTATTARMNGTSAARVFGGSMAATLVIEEIAA